MASLSQIKLPNNVTYDLKDSTANPHATDSSRLTTAQSSGLYKIATTAQGHVASVTAVTKADITGLGIPGTDTDTHRVIKVNGTQALASNTTALNLVAGSNVSITDGGSGSVTIAATDTTYSNKAAASGGTAVSLVTTGEKYNWNNKAETYYATCSTAQGTAAKVATIEAGPAFDNTDLVEGVTVRVKFTAANTASNPTLKVGSADAKPIYRYGTTTPSTSAATSWQAGSVIAFTYDGAGWQMNGWLNDNTTYSVFNSLSSANGSFVANSVVYRYQMLFHVDADKITPLNNVSNGYNSTSKTMLTNVAFDPFGGIYYYITTTTVNANAAFVPTYLTWAYGSVDLRYTFNISASVNALTAHKDVYMKVIPQTDGKVKMAAAFPLVQSLPTSDDGYWYIYLGRAFSTYQMSLYPHHPVYYHDGTAVRELVKGADIRYTEDSTPPSNPMDGTIWLQKKDSTSVSGTNLPNAMFQTVSITIPHSTTSYTYTNSWITNETAIIQTDLAANGMRDTYITWTISTGQIVFTLGAAVPRDITFQAAMIK